MLRELGAGLRALAAGMAGGTAAEDTDELRRLEAARVDSAESSRESRKSARFALMCRLGEKQLIEAALREIDQARGIAPDGRLQPRNGDASSAAKNEAHTKVEL